MKRSILFGVLAMFAVSALSVQNVNAQDETTTKKPSVEKPQINTTEQAPANKDGKSTNAINEPKEKPSPIKVDEGKTTDGKVDGKNQEPQSMRDMQKPQGEKNTAVQKSAKKSKVVEKTNKKSSPKKIKSTKMKNDAKPSVNSETEKNQGKEGKPAMKKETTMKSDAKQEVNTENKKDDNNGKPAMKKETTMKNDAKPSVNSETEKKQGKENKPAMKKETTMKNDAKQGVKTENKKENGSDKDQQLNKSKKLQKQDVPEKPNSVVGPKMKVEQGTSTENTNGTK